MRTGLIAKKIGMTHCYNDAGEHVPVTVLKLDSLQVVDTRQNDKHGYDAVVLGAGGRKPKHVKKPQAGYYKKNNVLPKQKLVEFRVSNDNLLNIGDEVLASHFINGQYIDVTSYSIGKGFAGAMKRHNFSGLRATHGVSISHRSHGSTGHCQEPGKVFKGKKMAGHMGNRRVSVQNLQVFRADSDNGLILVRGGVPGAKNSWVLINDAVKKALPADAIFPASVRKASDVAIAEAPVEENKTPDNNISEAPATEVATAAADNKQADSKE